MCFSAFWSLVLRFAMFPLLSRLRFRCRGLHHGRLSPGQDSIDCEDGLDERGPRGPQLSQHLSCIDTRRGRRRYIVVRRVVLQRLLLRHRALLALGHDPTLPRLPYAAVFVTPSAFRLGQDAFEEPPQARAVDGGRMRTATVFQIGAVTLPALRGLEHRRESRHRQSWRRHVRRRRPLHWHWLHARYSSIRDRQYRLTPLVEDGFEGTRAHRCERLTTDALQQPLEEGVGTGAADRSLR